MSVIRAMRHRCRDFGMSGRQTYYDAAKDGGKKVEPSAR